MKLTRRLLTVISLATILHTSLPIALACGPGYLEPVFIFENSPDIPFQEFTSGNIGIIRPTFGRKALFVAYRYANGGSFSFRDQEALVDALRGKPPEDNDVSKAVEAWIAARKLVAVNEEKLPEIYTDRNYSGYNFFPNCTRNAFEVATQVLSERAATYGFDNPGVREWLKGQDHVFDICSSGNSFPAEAGPDSPAWLKKDRAYQIAAANFYALNFDEALRGFEAIAADNESVWQETADYLIGRTLVRQASLTKDEERNREIYDRAESHLEAVIRRSSKFALAAEQLIGLIKYRSRPKERVHELAETLLGSGNGNLRQDLIDYTWLLDKFESEVLEEIQKRRAEEEMKRAEAAGEKLPHVVSASTWETQQKAIRSGEIILVGLTYSVPEQQYPAYKSVEFKPDITDEQLTLKFEELIGRKLTAEERAKALESKAEALDDRRRYLGANYRFGKESERFGYEGDQYRDENWSLEIIPEFLRRDDLSDWIFSFQVEDEQAYSHSVRRWRETGSPAWLMIAMTKAKVDSPELARLVRDTEKLGRTSPAYPTVSYHLARLKIEQNKTVEARALLDEVLASDFARLPVSSQNSFLELRMRVSANLVEFLKFASRKAVTFDSDGRYGAMRDLMEEQKSWWNPENSSETREEYVRSVEDQYRDLLPWDDRSMIDPHTADILNRHFPLDLLAQAALNPALPEHLRESLVLTVWTRAVLLGRRDVSMKFVAEGMKQPAMFESFTRILNVRTEPSRRTEELWLLIKNPKLSAFVKSGIPKQTENEVSSWEDGWWVEPSDTQYDDFKEIPKVLHRPTFITAAQSAVAMTERRQITALGSAESFISARVFEWAIRSPRDPRIPEALFIVVAINTSTKYAEGNEELREKAMNILETKYANSPWTAKAKSDDF